MFGGYDYAALDQLFRRFDDTGRSLAEAHRATFGLELPAPDFNCKQVFVVLTNGLDVRTREAIRYWRKAGLDVRPWVYRVYADRDGSFLLEMARFAVEDNPYEAVAAGFYILNTNHSNNADDHEDMLANKKAAAYFKPWKHKIERLSRGDTVFLYQSGTGIVAMGRASGQLERVAYHGEAKHADEEYFMKLDRFQRVTPPVSAATIKRVTGTNHRFLGTMFGLDPESGAALVTHIQKRVAV